MVRYTATLKANDSATQNTLQPSASRSFISCALRLNTSKSSSSRPTTNAVNASQNKGVFSMLAGKLRQYQWPNRPTKPVG